VNSQRLLKAIAAVSVLLIGMFVVILLDARQVGGVGGTILALLGIVALGIVALDLFLLGLFYGPKRLSPQEHLGKVGEGDRT
jgi:hypothetical protein